MLGGLRASPPSPQRPSGSLPRGHLGRAWGTLLLLVESLQESQPCSTDPGLAASRGLGQGFEAKACQALCPVSGARPWLTGGSGSRAGTMGGRCGVWYVVKGAIWGSESTSVLTVERGTRRQKGLETHLPPTCAQSQPWGRQIREGPEIGGIQGGRPATFVYETTLQPTESHWPG